MEMSRQRIRTSVLESSTEKCPHCGGTGHVRSVSSVALQLLRSIEEMLLKGPTHNLIIRTRPEIALYVLNHKRAHLRGLEERFRVTLTVNSDEEVGGQIGFVIDRGEQVMTAEQAKALIAQQAVAAPVLVEEEPEGTETFDEEIEAEPDRARRPKPPSMASRCTPTAAIDGGHEPGRDGDAPREGGREGGRGRRRRRRGRGGRGREGGPPQHREQSFEQGGHSPSHDHEPAQNFGAAGRRLCAAAKCRPSKVSARAVAEGGGDHGNGDGEPRRRRRGRRGGRRNRRGREGNGDFAATQGRETQNFETHSRPDHNERPDWSPPREAGPVEHALRHEPQPAPQPAAAAPAPAPTPAPAPVPEAPRRRSTVREAAPVFSGGAPRRRRCRSPRRP